MRLGKEKKKEERRNYRATITRTDRSATITRTDRSKTFKVFSIVEQNATVQNTTLSDARESILTSYRH